MHDKIEIYSSQFLDVCGKTEFKHTEWTKIKNNYIIFQGEHTKTATTEIFRQD